MSGSTVAFWCKQGVGPGSGATTMRIFSPETGLSLEIDDTALDSTPQTQSSCVRLGDLVAYTPTTGRVAFTHLVKNFVPGVGPVFAFAPHWAEYDLEAGTFTTPQRVRPAHSQPLFTNAIVMNARYVVWQASARPGFGPGNDLSGPLYISRWDETAGEYVFLGELPGNGRVEAPSLYGEYLVWADADGHNILMLNLEWLIPEDFPDYLDPFMVTLVSDLDGTIEAPAVWVDETTGEYVVLYQSSHSPTDLMVVTNLGSAVDGGVIPEPSTIGLLTLGLAAIRFRRHLPRKRRGARPRQ